MDSRPELIALENIYGTLESVTLDPFNTFRFNKELADARVLFMASEIGQVSDAVVQEAIRAHVSLSLFVIETDQKMRKNSPRDVFTSVRDAQVVPYEKLYDFVAQYFRTPCEMRIARVEDTLRAGIDFFPDNSIIPMELGKAYYGQCVEYVRKGNTRSVPTYLAKVQQYFHIAAQRSPGEDTVRNPDKILKKASSYLPKLRGTQR